MLSSRAFSPPPPRELAGAAQGKAARGGAAPPAPIIEVTDRDIVFDCPHCAGELVIDQDGAGMTLACSHCEKEVTVPRRLPKASTAAGSSVSPANPRASNLEAAPTPTPTFSFADQSPEQISKRAGELKLQLTESSSHTPEMRGPVSR